MRNLGCGVIVGLALATACGGGAKNADTTATAGTGAAAPPAGASAAAGGAAAGAGAAQAATGTTHEVKMIGDGTTYKYDPATLTIKRGDAVKWTLVSGPPHNVSFWADSIPANASTQLNANMTNTMAPLTSPLFNNAGESYTISFAGVPAGTYKYYCTPHLAMGMKGTLTIQ